MRISGIQLKAALIGLLLLLLFWGGQSAQAETIRGIRLRRLHCTQIPILLGRAERSLPTLVDLLAYRKSTGFANS